MLMMMMMVVMMMMMISDGLLFAALARVAEQRAGEFTSLNIANLAWAFAAAA